MRGLSSFVFGFLIRGHWALRLGQNINVGAFSMVKPDDLARLTERDKSTGFTFGACDIPERPSFTRWDGHITYSCSVRLEEVVALSYALLPVRRAKDRDKGSKPKVGPAKQRT